MILMKANAELKIIFRKLINTMGIDLKWNDIFVIKDNNLILPGKDSVLFFDYGNKMIGCNPVKLNLKEDSIEQITINELLENVLNMTLYVFGKWGKIKGLTVEKDYQKLNQMFGNLLKQINIDPVLTEYELHFYRDANIITYEDAIQAIIELQKQQNIEATEDQENDQSVWDKLETRKYDMGLWHKLVWTSANYTFEKEKLSESDKAKARTGNNFYMVTYKCPVCKEKLYMVVYPEGKELLIETDEKGVYLARIYTCSTCHRLYTPKPHMLLMDGKVFCFHFEDDANAYEDYLELVGKQGERTSNCNFNEYEEDYKNRKQGERKQLETICKNVSSMSDKEVAELQDKMDSGFYPQESTERYYKSIFDELRFRRYQPKEEDIINEAGNSNNHNSKNSEKSMTGEVQQEKKNRSGKADDKQGLYQKNKKREEFIRNTDHSLKPELSQNTKQLETEYNLNSKGSQHQEYSNITETDKSNNQRQKQKSIEKEAFGDYSFDQSENDKTQSNPKQAQKEEKQHIHNGSGSNNQKENDLLRKVEDCKGKNYVYIQRVINEVNAEDKIDSVKETALLSLKELLAKQGKKELDAIRLKIPENVTKTQYKQFKEMIGQYQELDYSDHIKHLDDKRDESEKREIAAYIKKYNAKDRNSFMELYQRLQKEDFEKRNVTPFLENIHDKIYAIDEKLIKKICPDPADLSYEEGLHVYKELSSKELLPELKSNILGVIDKRLTKVKMNECEQLINKLSKDMNSILSEKSRVHFYDVKKGIRNNTEDEETQIINRALNTYASGRGRYEYPIIICDTSGKKNGGRGFVLTPDHIFYNRLFDSGVIDVMNIDKIAVHKSMFRACIYAYMKHKGKVKISNSLELIKFKPFVSVLNDFVAYLKEKPESRDVSYMIKEKHSIKICYRCGFKYKGGNLCPNCGAKFND